MTPTLQCNDEVFPGYILSDRLGSGGYAEVWRARAPGGIEKAIKFVYGYYDEELAAQEMKAMERIKDVRHPFLLSLERFEVVEGRLAILTELADLSLDQRARQCRAEGHNGIPRDELLRYMSDAADALDFLGQKHGLQHLDIKPENLLVSGDHIKVADFGLVKELTTRTQNSLIAGMTPTYASPEMFDDMPSVHSDQYSLAIVYQEMLIGTLPFPGRTAAQLAKQHTQAEPQLLALPVQDRPIVAKALAKNPEQRFPSCRAFVEALKSSAIAVTATPIAPSSAVPSPSPIIPAANSDDGIQLTQPRDSATELVDDTQLASARTTQRNAPARPPDCTERVSRDTAGAECAASSSPECIAEADVPEKIVDIPVPEVDHLSTEFEPTLYVGIGGVGIQALCRLRDLLAHRIDLQSVDDRLQMVALDTDRNELRQACSRHWKHPLLNEDTLHLSLRLPKSYDEDCRESLAWLSRRWLYNIPRSLETRGFRPLGRVALVDHGVRVRSLLDRRIARLLNTDGDEHDFDRPPMRAVILSGMGGGTGTGMLIDVANAIRSLAGERNAPIEVHGFLLCTCVGQPNSSPLAAANTYALLTELTHASEHGNQGPDGAGGVQELFEATSRPFDAVYCVPTRNRSVVSPTENDANAVVKYLAAEATSTVVDALRQCRKAHSEEERQNLQQFRLRTLGVESLNDQKHQLLSRLADDLGRAIKRHWLQDANAAVGAETVQSVIVARTSEPSTRDLPESTELNRRESNNNQTWDGLRSRFGKHSRTRFAYEILSQIERRMAVLDERGKPSLTARHAHETVAAIAPVLNSLAGEATQPTDDSSNTPVIPCDTEYKKWIVAGSNRVLNRLIDEALHARLEASRIAETINAIIAVECMALLEADLEQSRNSKTAAALADSGVDIERLVQRASPDLLRCGYDRRTLLFARAGAINTLLVDKLKSARPLAAIASTESDDEILICEGSGVSPRSVARALERLYPGIAEAAHRLLTRIDIEWESLTK